MKYGFIRACAATPNIRVADTAYNAESILADMKKAKAAGVELLVFPELCVTGYTCGDLFGQDVLLDGAEEAILKIAAGTKGTDMLVFAGVPVRMGGVLYNCAAALADGRVLGFVPKRHLPNYAEFYEKRNFQPYTGENTEIGFHGEIVPFGRKLLFQSVLQPELIVAAELCEDLWVPAPPSGEHAVHGATVIVNLSASDETAGKADYRELLCRSQSAKTVSGYVYADAGDGESTTDMVFAGHNILCENGVILAESRLFDNGLTMSEIDVKRLCYERRRINTFYDTAASAGYRTVFCRAGGDGEDLRRPVARNPFVPEGEGAMDLRAENILSMQAGGLKKRIAHTNAKTCVLGISGGLDSALALLVTLRAFRALGKDPEGIIAVTMPCFGTTEKTLSNSVRLMKELGVTARRVDIAEAVRLHFRDIGHDESVRNAAYENSQARMRTMVLMNIANDTGGFVVGTGDLSELALGWATYNGDHMSMYGVNASVPKTLVKYLIRYEAGRLGGEAEKTLGDILATEISPELLPPEEGKISQKTEEIVGPYELHDFFLYHAIRWGENPEKIYFLAKKAFADAYPDDVILKWLKNFYRRFFSQQFKRSCLPDGVKVGSVTLSPRGDWRMPSDASAKLWLDEAERLG